MALQSAIARINAARKEYEDALKAVGTSVAQEVANDFGQHLPPGFVLQWQQGTPSFNDGDPCVFRVRDAYLYRVELDERGRDPKEGEHPEDRGDNCTYIGCGSYGKTDWAPLIPGLSIEQFDAISALWKQLDSDVLKRIFGDGSEIFIKSGGELRVDDWCDY